MLRYITFNNIKDKQIHLEVNFYWCQELKGGGGWGKKGSLTNSNRKNPDVILWVDFVGSEAHGLRVQEVCKHHQLQTLPRNSRHPNYLPKTSEPSPTVLLVLTSIKLTYLHQEGDHRGRNRQRKELQEILLLYLLLCPTPLYAIFCYFLPSGCSLTSVLLPPPEFFFCISSFLHR